MHYSVPVAAFLCVRLIASAAFLAVQVAAPAAAREIGLEAALVGVVSSFAFLGTMVGSPSAGALVARLGAVRVMQAGLAAGAAALALASTGYPWLMVVGAFCLGAGQGPITPAGSDLIVRYAPRRGRSFVFGLTQSAVPLGSALVGALVPLMAMSYGWRAGLWSVVVLCLALAVLIHPLHGALDAVRDRSARVSAREVLGSVRLVLAHRGLREVTVIAAAFGAMQWCVSTFLVAYLEGEIGLAYVAAGYALTLAQMGGAAGRVLWGPVADAVGSPRLVLVGLGLAMSAGGLAAALITPAWPAAGAFAVAGLLGVSAIGWNGIYLAELARLAPPGRSAAATGGSVFVFSLVTVIAPAAFSALIGLTGTYTVGFLALAAVTLIATLRLLAPAGRRVLGAEMRGE